MNALPRPRKTILAAVSAVSAVAALLGAGSAFAASAAASPSLDDPSGAFVQQNHSWTHMWNVGGSQDPFQPYYITTFGSGR
ncbi:hypothetical protein [Streptomyces sp. NPDC001070]